MDLTLLAALGGLALGVLNTWRNFLDDRVKLRFSARLDRMDDMEFATATVTNLSKFPVAIATVDLLLNGGRQRQLPYSRDRLIDPRRAQVYTYRLRAQYRPDTDSDLSAEDVRGFLIHTECGITKEVPIKP